MIITFIANLISYFSIIGFSYIFLKYILNKSFFKISNLDIFYGVFLLIIISIFCNFFIALEKIQLPVLIIGVYFFYRSYKKKVLDINFFSLVILILIFSFISTYSFNNADSPIYHIQILKWLIADKAVFGLSNLEIRFGTNSTWHSLIAILNINFFEFNSKYYLSSIFLSIGINEIFQKNDNKNRFGYLYLNLCFLVLLLFSLIHPFQNGIILNHLSNPELDIVPMILFILAIYVLICFYSNPKNSSLFYLYCIICFVCVTSRIVYAPLILPIIFNIIRSKEIINKKNIILIIGSCIWFLKSFINSGCIVFPYTFTCFKTSWSPGIEKIDYFMKEAMSFARDTPLRAKYGDHKHTLESFDWFMPWFTEYFLVTSLLNIFTLTIFISLLFIIFFNIKKIFVKKNEDLIIENNKLIILILFLTLCIWFNAPEVRLGWGIIIAFPVYILSYSLALNFFKYVKSSFKFFLILQVVILTGLIYKNIKNINYFTPKDLYATNMKSFDYTDITKLGNYDGFEIYVSYSQRCYDFKEICVNRPRKDYKIEKKLGYKIIYGK